MTEQTKDIEGTNPPASGKAVRIQQKLTKVASNLFKADLTGIYYGIVKKAGKQYKESLETTDPALAKKKLREHLENVERLTTTDGRNMEFAIYDDKGELVGGVAKQWFKSKKNDLKLGSQFAYLGIIKYLSNLFPFTMRGITPVMVSNWRANCPLSARAFNMRLFILKSVMRYAVDNGIILHDPTEKIKRKDAPKVQRRIPTRNECGAIITYMREHKYKGADVVEFMGLTGCRISEAIGDKRRLKKPLCWGQVSFEKGTVTFLDTKTEPFRPIPMTDKLRALLLRLLNELPTEPTAETPVFNASVYGCWHAIQVTCEALGLPAFNDHDFRRMYITNCIEDGANVYAITKWVGHANLDEIMTYAQLRAEQSQKEAGKLTFWQDADPSKVVPMDGDTGDGAGDSTGTNSGEAANG